MIGMKVKHCNMFTLVFFGGVHVAHRFNFVYCPIMCLYVLSSVLWCPIMCLYAMSSVLWCPIRFLHNNDVRFVFTSSCLLENACLIYVFCVCLRIVVSNTYCVVALLCLSSFCVPFVAQFLWIVLFWLPLRYSLTSYWLCYAHLVKSALCDLMSYVTFKGNNEIGSTKKYGHFIQG